MKLRVFLGVNLSLIPKSFSLGDGNKWFWLNLHIFSSSSLVECQITLRFEAAIGPNAFNKYLVNLHSRWNMEHDMEQKQMQRWKKQMMGNTWTSIVFLQPFGVRVCVFLHRVEKSSRVNMSFAMLTGFQAYNRSWNWRIVPIALAAYNLGLPC